MKPDWRRRGVVYQIYPRSFRDANGDGVGDLKGITEGLEHIARLGADIVWLSPIFASPMVDNGYDVSDYRAVDPLFGTMDDFDAMIAQAKRLGLRVVLDIALNHTSTAHPWFVAARADPAGPFRDFYVWRDGRCGGPPNNWRSVFGGPAWTQPEGDPHFYLHLFDKTQADLNWTNPAVRREIYDAMRFWLDRGVGGFRLDVVTLISKPPLNDIADTSMQSLYAHVARRGPDLHAYLREMRREVFAHYDCIAIGEAPGVGPAEAARLVDPADPMLDLIYHFDLVTPRPALKSTLAAWNEGVGPRGWPTTVISNHDLGRVASRFGDGGRESAKMLLALALLMRGTPFLYQGDELGLVNAPYTTIDELDDVWAKNLHRLALQEGLSEAEAFARALEVTRDHARTPFPWRDGPSLGFSAGRPWLAPNPRHAGMTVAAQDEDAESSLAFARALIALRRADPLWTEGDFALRDGDSESIFVFSRRLGAREGLVALNLRNEPALIAPLPERPPALSNYESSGEATTLRPFEARVYAPL